MLLLLLYALIVLMPLVLPVCLEKYAKRHHATHIASKTFKPCDVPTKKGG